MLHMHVGYFEVRYTLLCIMHELLILYMISAIMMILKQLAAGIIALPMAEMSPNSFS